MMIAFSPQVTVMAVKNSISHKLSLIDYLQLHDKCSMIDELVKKTLTVHCPNRFMMLFCIPPEVDQFDIIIIIITFIITLPINTFAYDLFRSYLQTYIHRNFQHLSPLNMWYVSTQPF
jgi:hypothetical protein